MIDSPGQRIHGHLGRKEQTMMERRATLSRRQFLTTAAAVGTVTAAASSSAEFNAVDPWAQVRRQFPVEPGLVYFNSGTYGPSSREVAAAECRAREAMNRNFNRFFVDHFISERFIGLIDRIAGFIGAGRNDIAFTSGATEGMNFIAAGLDLQPGDEVLTTTHEHQAGIYPWLLAAKRRGITVRQLPLPTPIDSAAEVLDRFDAAVTPRTRVVSFCHVQYTDGCRLPVAELCELARDRGLISVVDGAQSIGMLDFSVREFGCDFFATSLHKWLCGPYGTGLIYVNEAIRDRLWPTVVEGHEGWQTADRFGRDPGEPSLDFALAWPTTMTKYATNLHYYGPLFWALLPAIDLQELIGRSAVEDRAMALAQRLRDGLLRIDGARILSPNTTALRSAITSFSISGFDPKSVNGALAAQLIVTRSIDHSAFGFTANRVCTHIFNSEEQVDGLLTVIETLAAGRA